MSKTAKETFTELSDEEILRVQQETARRDQTRPRAAEAFYLIDDNKVGMTLKSGVEVLIPARSIQGLRDAAPAQIAKITLTASGNALHWPELDVQMSVEGLLAGIFGTQAWMEQIDAEQRAEEPASQRNDKRAAKIAMRRVKGEGARKIKEVA